MTDIIAIEMNDNPGGLSDVLKTIKDNDIDLEYLYAFTHNKTDKAILLLHTDELVHTDELDNLVNVLKENNITVVSSEEVYNL